MRVSRFVSSASDGLHPRTRVSQSPIMTVSRLNNVFGTPCSQMASWPDPLRSRFRGQNIRFSDLRLYILPRAGSYEHARPAHERVVRETRRHVLQSSAPTTGMLKFFSQTCAHRSEKSCVVLVDLRRLICPRTWVRARRPPLRRRPADRAPCRQAAPSLHPSFPSAPAAREGLASVIACGISAL